ncbi:exportin-T-like [Neocloeon triangulifer]|uniref:exportin-T-like n=1 Tax=Neocloeon triangulifer TaxID=2078957 RepID=UPI00286EE168|nr:exportin-T-like [Neocloeon triangulifer]
MDRVMLQNLAQLVNSTSSEGQREALIYFEQLRTSEGAWKQCIELLLTDLTLDETVKYLCLQIIEHFIRDRYGTASVEQQNILKQFLQQWIQLQCNSNLNQKDYIRNKMAQIFCLVFLQDYPARWSTFFTDLVQTLPMGEQAVDNYLRVLQTIDTDVTSREAVDTPQEAMRNTLIKDTMRETSVPKMVESWFHILDTYQNSQPALAGRCLQVIGAYISWIDINLVVNDQFFPLLVQQLSKNDLREDAADGLLSIINKGMEPTQKIKLVDSLINILEATNILNPQNPNYTDDETEFTTKISKLVNGMGMMLLDCHSKFLKAGDESKALSAFALVERMLPVTVGFLANDYDDVSAAIIEFCKLYIYTVKSRTIRTESQEQIMCSLLSTVIKKLKYDESYNFESEGEDEAEFFEFRKQVKVILDNLVGLNKEFVLNFSEKFVINTIPQWRFISFADVEVAIAIVYYIGEALPNSGGNHFTGGEPNALRNMVRALVLNDLSSHNHSAVKLMYFETIVRYEKFFLVEPMHLENVLASFVDHRGIRNQNVKVQSRCAYLFSRFLKSVKPHIQAFAPNLLLALKDLLELNTPTQPASVMLQTKFALSDGDQLYIYEACSTLILASRLDNDSKSALFRELVNPLLQRIRPLLDEMLSEGNPVRKEALADCVCHAMALTSRSSKAFSSQLSMKIIGCHKLYLEALETFFLLCLQVPEHQQKLQGALRQYLHRMIVCLDVDILPIMPTISNMLLNASNAHSFQEYLPILIQLITKFKKDVIPFLSASFIPIINTMVRVLEQPVDENDEESVRDRQSLQRNYFLFISTIVGSNEIIIVLDCVPVQGLEQLLGTVVQGAVELTDPVAQKTCFTILKRLVESWGRRADKPGFHQYVLENIVPACFMAPMKSTFDLRDAQYSTVLTEIASCLKAVVSARCPNFDKFLCDRIFPLHNIHDGMANEFVQALYQADMKTFKNYIKQFFMQLRP